MANEYMPIDVSGIPDLLDLAEDVRRTKRPRVLRRADEDLAIIRPVEKAAKRSPVKKKSAADMEAFWSSFGSWTDVDTDKLKADISESRRLSTKPPSGPMTYLIDSDWVIEALNGRLAAQQLFSRLASAPLAISLITYGEVYEGIYFGRDSARQEAGFRQFLRGVTVLPLNRSIMQRFARVRGDLRKQGQLIGDPDLLIAATSLYHDLTLVTQNVRHFQRIPGLKLQ